MTWPALSLLLKIRQYIWQEPSQAGSMLHSRLINLVSSYYYDDDDNDDEDGEYH